MEIVTFTLGLVALLLVLAALAVPLARRLGLPLPVVVALAGLLYGAASAGFDLGIGGLALDSYDIWLIETLALDSRTLLTVFLPPMLFDMALAVNVRRMWDDIASVMILAVFAVLAATALVGLAVWQVSGLSLVACLMLGAAVATTDPAAVITTFREIGAPRRLLVVLEGESLLNDAAAIAIFTVLLAIAAGDATPGPVGATLTFLYSFGAGALTGLAAAQAAALLYPLLDRSAVAEASVTVALAYGAYLAAETGLGGSGVVAVVFAGLATGSLGFVRMGPRNWSTVCIVWSQAGFWAQTLVLLLVSALVPSILLDFSAGELALLGVVYLGALVARALILFGVLPVIERFARAGAMDLRQKTLVLWGGVRGAVTLVLALSLSETSALGEEARLAGELAAAFTLATLFLNASTLAFVTHRLGLDRLSPGDLAIRERIVAGSIERVRRVVSDLARRRAMEPEALAVVERLLRREARGVEAHAADAPAPLEERLRLGLAIVVAQEGRLIRRGFEEGAIGPRAMLRLRQVAERLGDAARAGGKPGYLAALDTELRAARLLRSAVILHRLTGWQRPLAARIELRHTAQLESERILRELEGFVVQTLAPMIGEDAAEEIRALVADRRARVDAEIDATELQYPSYCTRLERLLLLRAALRRERQQFERLFADGIIGPELHSDLIGDIDRRERLAGRPPQLDLDLSPQALIDRLPLFETLSDAQRRALVRHLRTRLVAADTTVAGPGERNCAMVFVAAGVLAMGEGTRLTKGDFFGDVALVGPFHRQGRKVVARSFSKLLVLSRRDLSRLMARDPSIGDIIAQAARSGAPPDPAT
ncbi:MAG: cation:proton antiporter [Pseudomonadota bacterium]